MAETVGETKLVEYRRDIIGVADPEGIVEGIAGVHRENQRSQNAEAEDRAHDPLRPAAAGEHGHGVRFVSLAFSVAKDTGRLGNRTPRPISSTVVSTTTAMAFTG